MNYAQDALWWRLTHPVIRDLAALLTAPPLWCSGNELSVRDVLGGQGFRYLLALNDHPMMLPENLADNRLGHYAENLLAFWLHHAPHSKLIAREITVFSGSQTIGALDLIAQLAGRFYHIELTCKYYGAADGLPENMVGLNATDTMLDKVQKLAQQNRLARNEWAVGQLKHLGIEPEHLISVSIVRGMGFTHSGSLPEHPLYPVNAWSGILLQTDSQWQQLDTNGRFYPLLRTEYLAPARVSFAQTLSHTEARQRSGCLMAQVAWRPDGFWHETQRLMLP